MIELKAAQIILVGLPLPAVLCDDQAWNSLEEFTGPENRPVGDIQGTDRPFGRGPSRADEIGLAPDGEDVANGFWSSTRTWLWR